MKYTKWLQATNMSETSLVGGKNASLGEMIQNLTLCGIKIPNGFTITTEGYDYFMTYNELNSKIEELVNSIDSTNEILFRQTLIRIRTAICNGKIPCDMEEEIINNYNELSNQYNDNNYKMNEELGLDGYVDVAVRSSATCEDTTNASFAGQQDTFLNVRGYSDLLDKIKGCFASLYNDRAVEYRNHFNYIGDIKLSVCVQKMIRSDLASAGVAFSIDTDSNCKDVVLINGAFGLGEMVVSGQIRPDEFLVFKPTLISNNIPIIDKKLGEKSYKMVYSNVKNERTSIIPIEASHKKEYCLSDTNVIKLAEWVVMIEKYYTKLYNKWCPMDIEWAVDGITDELYIIQARPETVCSLQEDNQLVEYKLTSNNLIIGSSFSFSNRSRKNIFDNKFSDFKLKIELAGNITNLASNILNVSKDEFGNNKILGLAYSQFIKSETGYIKHWPIGLNSKIAFRTFFGIAIPFGNSNSIPFSKSFFAGGSNDNRAWEVYRLGPGSSESLSEFNEANMKLAMNIEYRFKILGKLDGAVFSDFGNIWNVFDNTEDSKRTFNSFKDFDEIAIGSGIGLRYNLGYFVLRLDMGLKTYNPVLEPKKRWLTDFKLKKAVFNIGLNYPF